MIETYAALGEQLGIPELSGIPCSELGDRFWGAALVGLADGDIDAVHGPFKGRDAELYGETRFSQGALTQAVARTALENGTDHTPILDFQLDAADFFRSSKNPIRVSQLSSATLLPEAAVVDGGVVHLQVPPQTVMDLAACLTTRSYLADQVGFQREGVTPFTLLCATRLPFTELVLRNTYGAWCHPEARPSYPLDNDFYLGRVSSVADAFRNVLDRSAEQGTSSEIIDLMLCIEAQHTTPDDLQEAMLRAPQLLRKGGLFIVRTTTRLDGASTAQPTVDELTEWAVAGGFEERRIRHRQANLVLPSPPGVGSDGAVPVRAHTLVLAK